MIGAGGTSGPTGGTEARVDFFVSYTSRDVHWAEWIAWEIEAAGYQVVLQAWDFRPGQNFVLAMQEAATKAERTLMVLSPAYFESVFANEEWAAAFAQTPSTLLPVRVADFRPPGLLGAAIYVDFVNGSEHECRQRLLSATAEGRAKPATPPRFPGASPSPAEPSSHPKPDFPGRLPAVWMVPFRDNPFFVARESELTQLERALVPEEAGCVALYGMGGVGKTQLAAAYAYRQRANYDVVLWVGADTGVAVRSVLARLVEANALNLAEQGEKDEALRLNAVKRWLRGNTRWLLVLDNVDSGAGYKETLQWLQELGTAGHVLITSRRSEWPTAVEPVDVTRWPEEVATAFLLKRTGAAMRPEMGDEAEAGELAKELGGLPLALDLAAAYIATRRSTFADYRTRLQTKASALLAYKPESKLDYDHTVASTWLVSEQELEVPARVLLRLASFLAPAPIPRRHLAGLRAETLEGALEPSEHEALASVDEDIWTEALVELASLSLIELGTSAFSLHRLLALVQRARVSASGRECALRCLLHWTDAVVPSDGTDVRNWPVFNLMEAHLDTLAREVSGLPSLAAASVRPLGALSSFLYASAKYGQSEPLMRRVLAIDEASYGPEHPAVGRDLNNLAQLLHTTNRLAEAEPLMRRALTIAEASYDPEHPIVATALNNLATLLRETNRLGEAEPLLRRALAIAEASLGPEHLEVATGLDNLAQLLLETNRLEEAGPLLRRALAIGEASCGPEHPNVATCLTNLALLYQASNRRGEAEPLLRRALEIYKASYGPTHPNVAIGLNNLAQLLLATNRVGEAEPLMRRALAIVEASYGPEHRHVALVLSNLAQLMKEASRLEEAEPLMRRALAIFEASYGPENPNVATALKNLARLLQATNRPGNTETSMR